MHFVVSTAEHIEQFAQREVKPEGVQLCIPITAPYALDMIFHDRLKSLALCGTAVGQSNNKEFWRHVLDSVSLEVFYVQTANNIGNLHQMFWKGRVAQTLTKLYLFLVDIRNICQVRFYKSLRFSPRLCDLQLTFRKNPGIYDPNLAIFFYEILLQSNFQEISFSSMDLHNNVGYIAELLRRGVGIGRKIRTLSVGYFRNTTEQIRLVKAFHRLCEVERIIFNNTYWKNVPIFLSPRTIQFLIDAQVIKSGNQYGLRF